MHVDKPIVVYECFARLRPFADIYHSLTGTVFYDEMAHLHLAKSWNLLAVLGDTLSHTFEHASLAITPYPRHSALA